MRFGLVLMVLCSHYNKCLRDLDCGKELVQMFRPKFVIDRFYSMSSEYILTSVSVYVHRKIGTSMQVYLKYHCL